MADAVSKAAKGTRCPPPVRGVPGRYHLEYPRARDKTDKALEAYKFYVNSLYVAITRAVRRLYLIESDTGHPLIRLLGIKDLRETASIEVKQSSTADWQAEARRLELQGKQEQANQIRRDILKTKPVPWEICAPEKVLELLDACNKKETSQKARKALFDYALFHDEPMLIRTLSGQGLDKAKRIYYLQDGQMLLNHSLYKQQKMQFSGQYLQRYSGNYFKDVMRECELYGIDHHSSNSFGKKLLIRINRGHYILNLGLSIRQKEFWIDIYNHANIGLAVSFCGEEDKHFREEVISLLS
ncbi:MAG: hypothetical protein M0Z61_12365 [Nitrospiraceae bacterium]|nr:hypothetical protein [Nitrospiraceae bacterium]